MNYDTVNKKTIGSAAVDCALLQSRLVDARTCTDITSLMSDLKSYHAIENENFWFGIFAPGIAFTRIGNRNFVGWGKGSIIDRYVLTDIFRT